MNTQLVPIENHILCPPPLFCHSQGLSHLCVSLCEPTNLFHLLEGHWKSSLIHKIIYLLLPSMNCTPPTENCCWAQSQLRGLYLHFMTGPDETLGPDAGDLLCLRRAKHIEQVCVKTKSRIHLSIKASSLLSSQWLTIPDELLYSTALSPGRSGQRWS